MAEKTKVKKKLIRAEYHSEGASLGSVDVVVFVTEMGLYIDEDGIDRSDPSRAKAFYPHEIGSMSAFVKRLDLEVVEEF